MVIFLDTEFTSLDHPTLISVALVSDSGKEIYLETNEGWTEHDCSHFVRNEVLPLLRQDFISLKTLCQKISEFLEELPKENHEIACDSAIDFELLKLVLENCWPANVATTPYSFRKITISQSFVDGVDRYFSDHPNEARHNALSDARGNRAGWMNYIANRKS